MSHNICSDCVEGQSTRSPFPQMRAKAFGELSDSDIFGSIFHMIVNFTQKKMCDKQKVYTLKHVRKCIALVDTKTSL